MKYYTCDIKKMRLKNIGVNEDVFKIVTEDIVLEKNSPFYWNLVGKIISFKYRTFLPTKEEARTVLMDDFSRNPSKSTFSCVYADYGNMVAHNVDYKEYKKLKKSFKEVRD